MASLISGEDIDFRAYERMTDAKVKVRPASIYTDLVKREFAPRDFSGRRPRMSSTKLSTCIEFRPGETTCWAGFNGHRKSLLTSQVALDLCAQRERVLIASFEMQPATTLARMERQAFGVSCPTHRQIEAFGDWTDERLWLFDHMGRINPAKMLAVAKYFADELDGHHVFVDSMMMVCESEESMDEQKQFMTDIVRVGQETGLHMHVVAHCKKPIDEQKWPTKYDIKGTSAISDQAHNVCLVWANKAKKAALNAAKPDEKWFKEPDGVVVVAKQRNGAFEGHANLWWDESSFRFLDDRGSAVEPFPIEEFA